MRRCVTYGEGRAFDATFNRREAGWHVFAGSGGICPIDERGSSLSQGCVLRQPELGYGLESTACRLRKDSGAYAATRLAARDFSGSSIHELHGQRDTSMKEAASIVGNSIGKPGLEYVQLPSAILEPALLEMGLPKTTAELIIEMWIGANAGLMVSQETRSARNTTPTTLETSVASVFAPAYLQMV
jgi:hypothetical protein